MRFFNHRSYGHALGRGRGAERLAEAGDKIGGSVRLSVGLLGSSSGDQSSLAGAVIVTSSWFDGSRNEMFRPCRAMARREAKRDWSNIDHPDGIPQNIGDPMRLMCDILVLGFQTDATRVPTLKLNNGHSSLRFPQLGVDYMIHV